MARYGRDFEPRRMGMRDFSEARGYGGEYGERGGRQGRWGGGGPGAGDRSAGRLGGMRSDAGATRWDRFPGEEGWFGEGYAGYPGGDVRSQPGGFRGRGAQGFDRERSGVGYAEEFGSRYGGYGDIGFVPGRGDEEGAGYSQQRGGDADRTRVREIMTEDPESVTPDTTVVDVAKKMRDLDVGMIPVVDSAENRRLKGVITDRDLAVRVLAAGKDGKVKVSEYMTEQVETVNKNDTVREVFNVMKREQVRRVPVTDREGRLVGIIAQADLAVDYAGLDLQRETEVEEVIERISEPGRPRRR
jgi:CBS domain-containing protein